MKITKQPFFCKRGELTIRGYAFGDQTAPREAVILSHGFLANQSTVAGYARLIAELGFLAVTFDFCGGGLGGKSDGKGQNMTVLSEKADLLSVIQYTKKLPSVTGISLLGCSQGGFVSAMVARELGERKVKRLMLFYPALCIPDDARNGRMMFYRFDPNNIPEVLGRFPMKLGGDYARTVIEMDPYREIDGYTGPTLLLHGTKDSIVNISYARAARTVFGDCDYHEIMGGGHGFRGSHEKEARKYLKAFLSRNGRFDAHTEQKGEKP